ncbi:MAG: acyl carrier protein [Acidobacteriota bacterium]
MPVSIEDQLRQYVVDELGGAEPPGDHDLLIDRGFVASVRLLDLVGYIEEEFGIELRPVDVVPSNLATIADIARTVRRLAEPQA